MSRSAIRDYYSTHTTTSSILSLSLSLSLSLANRLPMISRLVVMWKVRCSFQQQQKIFVCLDSLNSISQISQISQTWMVPLLLLASSSSSSCFIFLNQSHPKHGIIFFLKNNCDMVMTARSIYQALLWVVTQTVHTTSLSVSAFVWVSPPLLLIYRHAPLQLFFFCCFSFFCLVERAQIVTASRWKRHSTWRKTLLLQRQRQVFHPL